MDLSESDSRSEDERSVVICVAEVKRSRYRVLSCCQLLVLDSDNSRGRELAHPTMDLSSDCLLSASVRIFCSTLLISAIGKRLNTSSGSTPAQSTSLAETAASLDFLRARYRRRRVSGVEGPEDTTEDDSARVGRRSESVRVCRRDEDGSKEISDEKDAVRAMGRWLVPARGVERVDIAAHCPRPSRYDEQVRWVRISGSLAGSATVVMIPVGKLWPGRE